jgi:hypothetical protein
MKPTTMVAIPTVTAKSKAREIKGERPFSFSLWVI